MPLSFRPHLLVVDDDASVREALSAALLDTYSVHVAVTGAEACASLSAHPIAAILLDAILGEERGLDLVARFRALSSAPILLLTGHSSEELAIGAVHAKVDDYLKKPVSLPDLCAALRRVLPSRVEPTDLAARARRALDAYPPKPFHAAPFAHEFGVSEMHLRRRFRAAYGLTPAQYLMTVRLDRAATLLRTTEAGVAEIAFDVGFPHVAWFTTCFRERFGCPPGTYRRAPAPTGPLPSRRLGGSNPRSFCTNPRSLSA